MLSCQCVSRNLYSSSVIGTVLDLVHGIREMDVKIHVNLAERVKAREHVPHNTQCIFQQFVIIARRSTLLILLLPVGQRLM